MTIEDLLDYTSVVVCNPSGARVFGTPEAPTPERFVYDRNTLNTWLVNVLQLDWAEFFFLDSPDDLPHYKFSFTSMDELMEWTQSAALTIRAVDSYIWMIFTRNPEIRDRIMSVFGRQSASYVAAETLGGFVHPTG